jgi:MFS family permease
MEPTPTPPKKKNSVRRVTKQTTKAVTTRVDAFLSAKGPRFRALALTHAFNAAGDTLVAVALADILFLTPDPSEARSNVVLYLAVTLAPFAVIGPFLGGLFSRFPIAYRRGLGVASALRAIVAILMVVNLDNDIVLFPLAFFMLVLSRAHGISRNSLLPVALEGPHELVSANARMAKIGVVSGAAAAVIGGGLATGLGAISEEVGSRAALLISVLAFAISALAASGVPFPPKPELQGVRRGLLRVARSVRLAQLATAGVRFINGFLLFLLAFAFRDEQAGLLDFGFLLGAAGLGYLLGAVVAAWLERILREEPMVVAALAIEAAAAFIAAQSFGLVAGAALAAAAGFAWGVAKLAFDGLLQRSVSHDDRGRAFVRAETLFQLAWVFGALIPTAVTIPSAGGLAAAGVLALGAQTLYVAGLIRPRTSTPPAQPST